MDLGKLKEALEQAIQKTVKDQSDSYNSSMILSGKTQAFQEVLAAVAELEAQAAREAEAPNAMESSEDLPTS